MAKKSAGILLYKIDQNELLVFLVHPGGPFWKNKDEGAWSIPKGEFDDDEDPAKAALREFEEETGVALSGEPLPLTPIRMKSGKTIHGFYMIGDLNADNISSNTFSIEWPPKSGRFQEIPEVDKGGWFNVNDAKQKINAAQIAFIDELISKV